MSYKKDLSIQDIQSKILYDPIEGAFFRLPTMNKIIFTESTSLLIAIKVRGKRYRIPAHNIAWFYEHGLYPDKVIMHRDMDKLNFKIENLKQVTSTHLIRATNMYKCLKAGIRVKPHPTDVHKFIVEYNDGKPKKKIFQDYCVAYAYIEFLKVHIKRDLQKLGVNIGTL